MSEPSLKEKTAKGLFWGGFSNGIQQLLNLLFGIVLTRILDAEDYGLVGMLSIFMVIASTLQESGFTVAIANKKDVNHKDYNAVFWFNVLVGISMYLVLFFCAPLIAEFYNEPKLVPLTRVLSIGFLVGSLGTAHNAYLFKNLMVKQKAIIQITALIVSGVTGTILALNGMAYWGLAIQNVTFICTMTACYWFFSPWRPTLHIDLRPLKPMLAFSSKILITNSFFHINNNLFSVILGKFYSATEVGYYTNANKWTYMGHSLISGMVNGVAQPILIEVSDDRERQQRVFRKMLRFTAFVSFPFMLGLSFIAREFIVITITDKWLPSAIIMQLLCIGGAFLPIINLYTNLIISKGKSNIYMWCTALLGILQLIILLLLYPYGILPMVSVYVAVNIGWLLVWQSFVHKEIGLKLFEALKDIVPYAGSAALVMAVTYFITCGITNLYLLIICKIVIAAGLYCALLWACKSMVFRESIHFILRKKHE